MPELSPEIQQLLVRYATSVAGGIVLLLAVWILAGLARRAMRRTLQRFAFDETLTKFFSNIVRWLILLVGVVAALSLFGIQTTSLAAILGGAGLAVGMALSGTLGNFAAGVMLLTFRPFKVGDVVTVAGVTGKVEEIGLFATLLDTPDNRRLILPNGSVFGSTIENVSHHPTRRVDVTVGTDYGADLDRTREVLERAVRDLPGLLTDPAPQVVLTGLGASSVDWQVRLWTATSNFFPMKEAGTRAVKRALDNAEIGIPFPQMDVHFDAPPGLQAAS